MGMFTAQLFSPVFSEFFSSQCATVDPKKSTGALHKVYAQLKQVSATNCVLFMSTSIIKEKHPYS